MPNSLSKRKAELAAQKLMAQTNIHHVEPESVDRGRNRRLFGQMIAWLLFDGRRPGMLGRAVAFRGRTPVGNAVLERRGDEWAFSSGAINEEHVSTAEVLRRVGTGDFFPKTVDVVPDLAQLLFMEAVHQAEVAHGHVLEAAKQVAELRSDYEDNVMLFVLGTSALDRAVRAGMTAVVMAIAAGEAQVNTWAHATGGWSQSEDREPLAEKCRTLAARANKSVSLGSPPFQQLHEATKRRNGFLHSMPVSDRIPATGAGTPSPGTSILREARSTCVSVRESFVTLARLLDMPVPSYLAYCPPGSPEDDTAWHAATLMTGVRPDPDFPPVSDRLARDSGNLPRGGA